MKSLQILLASVALTAVSVPAHALNVVASLKPVHSLVSSVMQGVDTPHLLIKGAASPHTYAMRPSDAQALQDADLIFWIGGDLEAFLIKPIESLGLAGKSVVLQEAPGMRTLLVREDATFERHSHDDDEDHDGHEDHDDHDGHDDHEKEDHHDAHGHDDDHKDKDGHDDHDHEKEHAHEDEHDHEKEHDHEDEHAHEKEHDDDHEDAHDHAAHVDPHFWLDPANAKAMVGAIAEALSKADPENADAFMRNAEKTRAALDALIIETTTMMAPLSDKPFIVFHDAYQYFENRFSISAAGAITLTPEEIPGAKRTAEVREKIKDLGAVCVFSEPQFTPRQVEAIVADTGVKQGILDPLGAAIDPSPQQYIQLIQQLAKSFESCLKS